MLNFGDQLIQLRQWKKHWTQAKTILEHQKRNWNELISTKVANQQPLTY